MPRAPIDFDQFPAASPSCAQYSVTQAILSHGGPIPFGWPRLTARRLRCSSSSKHREEFSPIMMPITSPEVSSSRWTSSLTPRRARVALQPEDTVFDRLLLAHPLLGIGRLGLIITSPQSPTRICWSPHGLRYSDTQAPSPIPPADGFLHSGLALERNRAGIVLERPERRLVGVYSNSLGYRKAKRSTKISMRWSYAMESDCPIH